MNNKIKKSKNRARLVQIKSRGGMYYAREFKDGKSKDISLGTKDEHEAHQLFEVKYGSCDVVGNQAARMAKQYMQKAGQDFCQRTWEDCFSSLNDPDLKAKGSIKRCASLWRNPVFDSIRDRKIASTNVTDLTDILKKANASGHRLMLALHKHAIDNIWLPDPLLTKKAKDSTSRKLGDSTATIDEQEYKYILKSIDVVIKNPRQNKLETAIEFKDWIELLWLVGGSSEDMASLTTDNVDWEEGNLVYYREKHKGTKTGMGEKQRDPVDFPMGEKLKALVLKRMNIAGKEGHKQLFPILNSEESARRINMFDKFLRLAGIDKTKVERDGKERALKIHSFRYAVACRMAECGISLRDAQYYLGHNCSAVARYYAGRASVKMEPLEDIEARCKATQEAVTKVA